MTFKTCALTPAQERQWDETRVALLWHAPAFSHIFYTLLNTHGSKHVAIFTKDLVLPGGSPGIAATDGNSVIINPDTYFKLNLMERVFVAAHEIMHCVWNHCILMHQFRKRGKIGYPDGKELEYDQVLMNVATDLVINDLLIESKIGTFLKGGLHDPKIATGKDSALDAYRKLYKEDKGKGGGGGVGGQGFDQHLDPGTSQGKDPHTAAQQRNEAEWQTQIAAAAAAAKAQGKLPAGLERVFNEMLNPQVDWREKIQALFARKVGSGSYDWRRADRRLIVRDIYAPGRSGFGAGTVVVGVDTSGSIGERELDAFFGELAGILEDVKPRRLLVMWCDAKVHRVDEAEDPSDLNVIRCKGAPGGGGTSFVPVFEEIASMGVSPDALVYLTDGYGSFPNTDPGYSVIWGNISKPGAVNYPWGDVVDIPVQAA